MRSQKQSDVVETLSFGIHACSSHAHGRPHRLAYVVQDWNSWAFAQVYGDCERPGGTGYMRNSRGLFSVPILSSQLPHCLTSKCPWVRLTWWSTFRKTSSTLANNSVDVVLDNLGFPGTADKALQVLRSGHEGTFSPNTKAGVTQVNFGLMQSITADLEALAELFDQGSLKTKNTQSFNLADTPLRSPDSLTPRST